MFSIGNVTFIHFLAIAFLASQANATYKANQKKPRFGYMCDIEF